MAPPPKVSSRDQKRRGALAARATTARAVLSFAAGLLRSHARMAAALEAMHRRRPLTGRLIDDGARVLEAGCEPVRFAAASGLADLSLRLTAADLAACWNGDTADYMTRAVLRPYVEVLARLDVRPAARRHSGGCPFCGGPPWMSVRRPAAEGEGGARYLACALCGTEWPIARVRCAACPETDPERLPSFTADGHPLARVEACESCRRYVKSIESIDAGLDSEVIPEVDELTSLALDVWARARGLERLEPGLAGALVQPA